MYYTWSGPQYSKFSQNFKNSFLSISGFLLILSFVILGFAIAKLSKYKTFDSYEEKKKHCLYNSISFFILSPCILIISFIIDKMATFPQNIEYYADYKMVKEEFYSSLFKFHIPIILLLLTIIVFLLLFLRKELKHKIYGLKNPSKLFMVKLLSFIILSTILIFIIITLGIPSLNKLNEAASYWT